jgi:hypothetical protein
MQEPQLSLWLVPAPDSARRLSVWIESFARRFAGPLFAPHLTLLSRVGNETLGVVAAQAVASSSGTVKLDCRHAEGTDVYFRNLYLRVSSDAAVQAIHVRAAAAAEQSAEAAFLPHLSLFYGHLGDSERTDAMHEVERELPLVLRADAVELWSVQGPVESWRKLARFAVSQ